MSYSSSLTVLIPIKTILETKIIKKTAFVSKKIVMIVVMMCFLYFRILLVVTPPALPAEIPP